MVSVGTEVRAAAALFAEAQSRLHNGDAHGAERLCQEILRGQPDDFPAAYLLGIISAAARRHEEAAALFRRAAALRPEEPSTHNNLGNVLLQSGRNEEALTCFEQALQRRAGYPEAHYNRGNALHALRRLPEALAAYERALQLKPQLAEAHNNRGRILREQQRITEALESFQRAVQLAPANAQMLTNLGVALGECGRLEEALTAHERAIQLAPGTAAAHSNRGLTLQRLRRLEEAVASYEQALRLNPADEQAWYNRGAALAELDRPAEAEVSFQRSLELRPEYAEAHRNRGELHWQHGRHESALASYQCALAAAPELPWMYGQWLYARMSVCDWSDWEACTTRLLERIENGASVAQPFVLLPVFDAPAVHRKVAAQFVREVCAPQTTWRRATRHNPDGRIRLGYFSADFREHPVAQLTAAVFETHDRGRFELNAFAFGPRSEDGMRTRLRRSFARFLEVGRQSDPEVARLAQDLGIDIAIDLTGFTAHNRAGIFAQRAAAVQVSYLGYPGTMQAPYIDYLVADATLIPPAARADYAEQVAYLPHSYLVNETGRMAQGAGGTRRELGLPQDAFVYCCFNNTYKLTPAVFAAWMRILQAVPAGVLWLAKHSELAMANLRRSAQAHGVAPERLVFAERVPSLAQHLARYQAADLFLDTFPYNAHTTASDALGAGLPVLSQPGRSFAARVAASLLKSVALPELIATGPEDYVRLAIELAGAPATLQALRARLVAGRAHAPLFDVARFTADLESLYVRMHERALAGLPAADLRL
jgi:predicted O-linked N-acetylglucosamine transferase (SPINDLY family)